MRKQTIGLLIFANERMAKEIAENLKRVRPDWDWKLAFVGDSQSAIESFRSNGQHLIFLSDKLPDTTPMAFSRELMKVSTETTVFCFHESPHDESYELELIPWPVVSWDRCAEQVIGGLSKELQEKLGSRAQPTPLRLSLQDYAKKYQVQPSLGAQQSQKCSWIPRHGVSDRAPIEDKNGMSVSTEKKLSQSEYVLQIPKRNEIYVLVGSLAVGLSLWLYQPEEEMLLLSGMRFITSGLIFVSFMGFFISRALFKIRE